MANSPNIPALLGADGRPLAPSVPAIRTRRTRLKSTMIGDTFYNDYNSWVSSIAGVGIPPTMRARDPFNNHAWVFAAAMTTATTLGQAPFTVMRETDEVLEERRRTSIKRYDSWRGPRRGGKRKAVLRHIMAGRNQRIKRKGLEPDYDHPIAELLLNPNPYQTGSQLFQMTHLWMAIRGEVFWVLESESGLPVFGDNLPERVWPLSPDLFQPVLEYQSHGELVAWEFCPPHWMAKRALGYKIILPLTDVIQFKFPNPSNPLRGLSKIGAVALGIEQDMLVKEYNKKIIENGGDPGGIIMYDADLTAEEEGDYIQRWEERYQGAENARRTALLSGGFKYVPVALSPKEMEWLGQQEWDREEILAVMNTPRSVLGVPDQNYATQLGQDANFWDKNLLPLAQLEETTLDSTMFHETPDDIVGVFDVRDIEALRAGVSDKVEIAMKLCGDALHVPPELAFDTVGLEIEEYEGSDIALIKPLLSTVEDITSEDIIPEVPPVVPIPPEAVPEEPEIPDEDEEPEVPAKIFELTRAGRARREKKAADEFEKTEQVLEDKMKGKYRSWVGTEKKLHLTAFDSVKAGVGLSYYTKIGPSDTGKFIAALPPLPDTKLRLKKRIRPLYPLTLQNTIEMTMSELGGVPIFDVDDPVFHEIMNRRERTFVNATPETLRKKLISEILVGGNLGEDVQSLRIRVAQVFDISSGSAKALQVARTETASLMNEFRDEIFDAQGITIIAWSTSRDEHVRDTHVIYGQSGDHEQGYNFLIQTDKEAYGLLARPGDTRCTDVSELINCRCKKSAKK